MTAAGNRTASKQIALYHVRSCGGDAVPAHGGRWDSLWNYAIEPLHHHFASIACLLRKLNFHCDARPVHCSANGWKGSRGEVDPAIFDLQDHVLWKPAVERK